MSRPAKAIRWSFYLLFFIVPLIFLPNTSELFEFNKMIAIYFFTSLVIGLWLAEMILQKKFVFRKSMLDWPILFFLIIQLLSLLFSIDQRTSLLGYYSRFNGGLVSFLCYSILYWAYVTFMDHRSALTSVSWLLTTACLVSVYGVLEHFGIDDQVWVQDVRNRVFSTLGQPNWLAAYLTAIIFIPLSSILSARKKESTRQFFDWLAFLLLFFTLIFTKSRSGFLAFGLSSIVFWGAIFINRKSKILNQFIVFVLLTLTLTLTTSNPIKDQYLSRLLPVKPASRVEKPVGPALETGGTESGVIRKIVWTGALRIWQASGKNFWLGTGPETFAMAYYQHRPVEHNATSEWELLYNKAHNEFLNYLATTGLLGLGSYLLLLGAMVYLFVRSENNIKKQTNTRNPYLIVALFAGWLTIPVTDFWGFSVVIINALMFLLPAAAFTLVRIGDEPESGQPAPLKSWQTGLFILAGTLTVYLFFTIFKYWLADVKYASGQKYLKSFSATQEPAYILTAYDDYLSAYDLNKNDPPISSDLATVMAYMSLLTSGADSSQSALLADTAVALAQSAVATSPYHPNYYKAQSRTALILSTVDPKYLDLANRSLLTAHEISPTDPRIFYNLALVARYQNNIGEAKKYLDQALLLKPDFADALAEKEELATVSATIF